jgi:hypothetical protein
MPKREVYIACIDCSSEPIAERFSASGELEWNPYMVNGAILYTFFEHHWGFPIGSGHNKAMVYTQEGGQEIGELGVTRFAPAARVGIKRISYAGLALTAFGRKIK